ncbi:T9SS type A sorting domain-containing protein [Chryseolinea lacunae]|uniref:T9SS type A sorting domain-containing protein n=1 Tax=Chryseolinea lacunae TaxID=2801331 RepID=A0ABS1KN69_9BACT|nr:T9SS type A sorting domain-containing protein [Chryseolinea lacunae]MBL0740905.1 T9SS type A sorting domain-containing protein [Chryseolinea lacunae]
MVVFTLWKKSRIILFALLAASLRLAAQSEEHRTDNWITDGYVDRVEYSNGYTMLSGSFSQVGPYTGNGVATDPVTGVVDASMPKFNGDVYAVAPDGTGGWFVGGYFYGVDTVQTNYLAHIKSDKTIDRTWKPELNGVVYTLAVSGTTLYVGGGFTEIAGKARSHIASFDISTGALNAWNPNASSDVRVIKVSNDIVYAGGGFSTIGGASRISVAAINAAGTATSWAPVLALPPYSPYVYTLLVDQAKGTVYIGGSFSTSGGLTRQGLSQVNITTGATTSWNANLNVDAYVYDLAMSTNGNVLFVGGYFNSVGGAARTNLAALDVGKASLLAWNPVLQSGDYIQDMSLLGNTLYIAGYINTIGGISRTNAAALDVTAPGTAAAPLTNWAPRPTGGGYVVEATAASIFFGGYFSGVNWVNRNGFAVIDDATGEAWPFSFDFDNGGHVNTIVVKDNVLYIGGKFGLINKTARKNLAAFDLTTGKLSTWAPTVNGVSTTDPTNEVFSMRIKDNLLYLGGQFFNINSNSTIRPGLAAIDLATGVANAWNPQVGNGKEISEYVNSIDIVGNTVYAGGNFATVGNTTRSNLAAVDATTGSLLSWAPVSTGEVKKIRVAPAAAYVIGSFEKGVGGQVREAGVAALNLTNGNALSWNPDFDFSYVADVALSTTDVYVAGFFYSVDGSPRPGLASFSLANNTLNPWNPDINTGNDSGYENVSLSTSSNKLFVGGGFGGMGREARQYFGEYDICPAAPVISISNDGTTLTIPSTTPGTLQWYHNAEPIDGATTTSLPINLYEYGIYAVELSLNGCTSRSKDYVYLITGRETTATGAVSLYPNPARDELTVRLAEAASSVTFTFTDITGRTLSTRQGSGMEHVLSVRELPTGVNILMIETPGRKQAYKIMKIN